MLFIIGGMPLVVTAGANVEKVDFVQQYQPPEFLQAEIISTPPLSFEASIRPPGNNTEGTPGLIGKPNEKAVNAVLHIDPG